MITLGIDIGSTTSKCILLRDGKEIIGKSLLVGGMGTDSPKKAMDTVLKECEITPEDVARTIVTGYGRKNFEFGDGEVSERTCHGLGGRFVFPELRSVIDIGGQDTKIIILENGMVKDFAMNDKCSAGTGRFLEVMANTMALRPDALCELARKGKKVKISSMCTVFAESEVISLIGQGEKKENIAFAVVNSIADKVAAQCSKMNVGTGEVFLTGGLCECGYLQEILEQKLGSPVLTGPECRYAGAIGAALCSRNI